METWRRYYDIVYKISSLTGAWPYLKPRTRILRVAVLTAIMLTVVVPQIAYQFTCKTDVRCIFEAMTSYLLTTVALLKIKGLTRHLFVAWKKVETPKECEIMKLYAENSRRFCLVYMVYCSLATFTFMSMSLIPFALDVVWPLNESRPILPPYPGYYFVDSREYFFKIFWHSIIAWEIIMTGIIAHDCMFVTYVEHICSMFAIVGSLQKELNNLSIPDKEKCMLRFAMTVLQFLVKFSILFDKYDNKFFSTFHFENLFNCDEAMEIKDNLNDIYRKKIVFFVNAHREALKLTDLLENIFTIPFAFQMLIVTIGISITLLQITHQDGDILESIRYVLYVIGQLIHLFFLSFEGQKLIDHSLQMCNKIYSSSWYEVSTRSQKLIVLVMMKGVRPSFLTAGKMYIFSLESFTTVLQTSMSYFTVLASFQ